MKLYHYDGCSKEYFCTSEVEVLPETLTNDNILSACTYATSTVPQFLAEGQYCVQARDATWSAAYAILDAVQAGERPMPGSIADIEDELPALAWPDD